MQGLFRINPHLKNNFCCWFSDFLSIKLNVAHHQNDNNMSKYFIANEMTASSVADNKLTLSF